MPTQWESLANEHILGIAPYEPGKPIEELERELMIHNPIKLAFELLDRLAGLVGSDAQDVLVR